MEVSGQLHAPADLLPWKELLVPITMEAGWVPGAGLDMMRKIAHPTGNETPATQPVTQSLY